LRTKLRSAHAGTALFLQIRAAVCPHHISAMRGTSATALTLAKTAIYPNQKRRKQSSRRQVFVIAGPA
jgi:hypothetical protein